MRLLIAVGQAASDSSDVPAGVLTLIHTASDILVMSPSLMTTIEWMRGDYRRARRVANELLGEVLDQFASEGVAASGRRGDEDPRTAFEDAIRDFAPDHILIAFRNSKEPSWQRKNLIENLLDRYALPVTAFVVPGPVGAAEAS